MASISELIVATQSIKQSSSELSESSIAASQTLQQIGMKINVIAEGSTSGKEALEAISIALRSLSGVASTLRVICRTCDCFIENISA